MKKKLKTLPSTQQFLPVEEVRGDIVCMRDGTFVKCMEFSPINFELRSPQEQDRIIELFGAALRTWPRNVHIKIITIPSDVRTFIGEILECREQEESGKCRELQTDQIELLRQIGRTTGVTRRFFISFPYEAGGGFRKAPTFREIRYDLDRQARTVQQTMEACGNVMLSMDSRDNILSMLYSTVCKAQSDAIPWEERKRTVEERYRELCLSGGKVFNAKRIPASDYFAPERIDSGFSPNAIVVDGKYISHCYIPSAAYSTQAYGGWLQVLFGYMPDVYVDFWLRRERVEDVNPRLRFALKNNKVRARQADDADLNYSEIEEAVGAGYYLKDALSKGDEFFYFATMLTIYADSMDELKEKTREMSNHCIRNSLTLRKLTAQQGEAFIASIPSSPYNKSIFAKSKRNCMAAMLGSCYPFTAYELCDKGGVFMGINASYGSPVFLNLFDNSKYQNANMMIFGPSGSGKTYTLLSMLLRMRQKGIQVFVIAPLKGFEFYRACTAIGGEYISIAPGSAQTINIMEIRRKDSTANDSIDGISETGKGSVLVKKIQQLHTFFSLLVPDMDYTESTIMDEALINTYRRFGIRTGNQSLYDPEDGTRYREMPTLADLYEELERMGSKAGRLHDILSRYVTGSAKTFSRKTNVNLENKFVVIDVSDLTGDMLPVGMFIALEYVLDKAQEDRTKCKVIAIDEMWRLMKGSRESARYVVELFKIIRGYAGAAIGATQDLADVIADESGMAVVNNAKTKLLLPMDGKEAEAVSKVIELTSGEIKGLRRNEALSSGAGKRSASKALLVANTNHCFVEIRASAKEHELITTSASDLRELASRNRDGQNQN